MDEFIEKLVRRLPDDEVAAIHMAAKEIAEFIGDGNRTSEAEDGILYGFLSQFFERVFRSPIEIEESSYYQDLCVLISLIQRRRSESMLDEYFAKKAIPEEAFGVAELTEDEKIKMRRHISSMQEIIDHSEISDKKKRKLFDRLNLMANEVDRPGTRTDEFVSFLTDLGFAVSGFARGAKPALDEAREMVTTVLNARARKEGVALNFRGEEFLSVEWKGAQKAEDNEADVEEG